MSISAIIVAAGNGSRLGSNVPKQYLDLGNKKIIEHSIEAFLSHPKIDDVVVIVSEKHKEQYAPVFNKYDNILVVIGGVERSDSVMAGLSALEDKGAEKVLIHDAARPFVSHSVIDRVINALDNDLAVIPVIPVKDTIKSGSNYVEKTIDRSSLNVVQTPQGFCYKTLMNSYADLPSFTDDAQVMEQSGVVVCMVEGDELLFKITTPVDQYMAEALVKKYKTK